MVKVNLTSLILYLAWAGPAFGITLQTEDVALTVESRGGAVAITSLAPAGAGKQWIDGSAKPSLIALIDHAIVEGKQVSIHWRQLPRSEDKSNTFRFVSEDPPLEAISVWHAAHGPGPIEHCLRIINKGKQDVILPRQTSLAFSTLANPEGHQLRNWWVEKGGGTPTPVGEHVTAVTPNFSLNLKSGPLAANEPRDPIPFVAMIDEQAHQGWYVGIEFSGRIAMNLHARTMDSRTVIDADLGLEPKDNMATRVPPGGSYEPPPAFIGCFKGDIDDCGNHLRQWVANELRPPVHNPHYPLLVNNSWGSGMAVDEKLARSMIDESAELGLEMFHIDAGWFRSVGDWRPNPAKFPNGLRPVADYAHQKGLKFGLWVGWTQAGNSDGFHEDPARVLSVTDPSRHDWIPDDLPRDWKPQDFTGATVCLADPAAEAWCLNLLRGLVKENRLDLLEHDQRMIIDNCHRDDHAHTKARVDVAFRAAEAYYRVYDALRKENPDLLFEDCVNGGQMVDFGVIRRCHYISITDTYDPLSNRRAFYDSSFIIPPAMCECYIEQHPGKTPANFLYMLRSGMTGWCTIMLDTKKWTPQQHEAAKRQFALYKTRLRPLINHANLYHLSPRPDGVIWDGIEYIDPKEGQGVLFAFRGTTGEAEHTFTLKGFDPAATYDLTYEDGSAPAGAANGTDLMKKGLTLHLSEPESSAIVYLRRR